MPGLKALQFRNHFLDALDKDDANDLIAQLDVVALIDAQRIHPHQGIYLDVYFPTSAVVALESALPNGEHNRLATIACEGMTPPHCMNDADSLHVIRSGFAYRLNGYRLRQWASRYAHRRALLKASADALYAQGDGGIVPLRICDPGRRASGMRGAARVYSD